MTEQEAFDTLTNVMDSQRCCLLALAQTLRRAGVLNDEWEKLWVNIWDCNTMASGILSLPVRSAEKIFNDSKEVWQLEKLFGDDLIIPPNPDDTQ